ncbi:MAG: dUTP diphosphatase [Chloroflexi bacterium]|nr:dUTP diphosphatase [Chloroflexota bacterium]
MTLLFARLFPDAVPPIRKHAGDAGVDVCALNSLTIPPFSFRLVHTGLTFEIPEGTMLEIRPKGRNNHLIGSGIVDAGYQGEIVVKVVNYSWRFLRIKKGDAVAQLVQLPVLCEPVEEVALERIHSQGSLRGKSGGIHQV